MLTQVIAVIIPTHNRILEISTLLSQLRGQYCPEEFEFTVIVVIDGSTDGTIEVIAKNYSWVTVVEGNGSWWYTRCINEGIKEARKYNPDFYLLLNDDINIKRDYLQKLYKTYIKIDKPCLLGTASISIEKPHRVTFSGIRNAPKFPFQRTHYIPFMKRVKLTDFKGYVRSQELPGRGMLIPKMVIDKVGLFDEKFPQYFSDIDFSRRAAKKGFQAYVSYEALTFSHVEKTSDSTTFKKISHSQFIKNLFNPYGRKHVGQIARYVWRHYPKISFPYYYARWIGLIFINHLRVNVFHNLKYGD